ncbi:uncharacterized protein FFUJ_09029 [Fusarium fujikuroi IMI 58289]|uniref:Uncharacterized protein n=1 Tax=Gibberella fujikuroi (strain CBS 195.34 / IMI 58289 / NRRL A-6831) TaxID=1279085 RepID=S0E7R4_GIBF5|nr:uncharacterized protein FFUJ_09029 [Fusarium fujikuroi IMI 58289]KLP18833.1 uncharacterized protein LW94_1913 [Fusarium fujikuroi]QGI66663.1 hypothetical protein CEK27_010634 [Fusarium fujikuroi]QGI83901.1 hypothetical protein CEK25_010630 [Fusarium fujikuroi]QGI97553.1 hypothetical protein CEK26_010622 [Fusarium fujikuroi]CCT70944.1 uncharacterized protein FFUJ_09029 [Fusarium fujikuroi IMI 58289]
MNFSQSQDTQSYPEFNVPPAAARSAEMPMLWDKEHCRLIDACVRHESLLELFMQLPKLADILEANQAMKDIDFPVVNTVTALRSHDWTMCELLHTMSVPVVQSIAKNTFAFDEWNRTIKPFRMPGPRDPEIPGVYVIGLRIPNRNGKFLNIEELERLIADMKLYSRGYESYARHGKWNLNGMSAPEKTARTLVKAVDRMSGATIDKADGPLFIANEEELSRIQALISTFEGMCDRSLDPTGKVFGLQSPLYVGCSKNLYKRTRVYSGHSVKAINKPLGLTVSILRTHAKAPELVVECVLRILKDHQLPMAEQLVATLAGSLVYQRGFNAVETGGTGSKTVDSTDGLRENIKHIVAGTQIMGQNLSASLKEANLRQRFLHDLDILNGKIIEISKNLESCKQALLKLQAGYQWDGTLDDMRILVRRLRAELEDQKEALKLWKLMMRIQEVIVEDTGKGIKLLSSNSDDL